MRQLTVILSALALALVLAPLLPQRATADEPELKARLDKLEQVVYRVEAQVADLVERDKRAAGKIKAVQAELSTVRSWIASAREQFALLGGATAEAPEDAAADIRITNGLVEEKVLVQVKGEEFLKLRITGRFKGLEVAGRVGLEIRLQDVHGRTYLTIDHTTETIYPGNALRYEGLIKLSDFGNEDVWARTVEARDIRVAFDIQTFTSVKDLPRSARSAR